MGSQKRKPCMIVRSLTWGTRSDPLEELPGKGVVFASSNVTSFAKLGTYCPFGETFRSND